ncbi:MAG: hypothetical protein GEU88_18605 [Solirubrobacterales bacterium]|nr:hypothetical protein [Solirubrobacterales bacterium]
MGTPGSQTPLNPGGGADFGAPDGNGAATVALALTFPQELIDAIAERAAEAVSGLAEVSRS